MKPVCMRLIRSPTSAIINALVAFPILTNLVVSEVRKRSGRGIENSDNHRTGQSVAYFYKLPGAGKNGNPSRLERLGRCPARPGPADYSGSLAIAPPRHTK